MDENEELKAKNERLENQVADYQAYLEQLENTHTTEHVNDRFTDLLNKLLSAIADEKHDEEMAFRSLIKSQFKLHDAKLEAKLFNLLIKKSSSNKTTTSDCVDLSTVEPLTYLMDGWLLEGDISLSYGSYGSGKTTHALYKAINFARGLNILDRDTPCKKGKTLFIVTDGGVNTFKKSMYELAVSENSPLFAKGKNQKIFVWGYEQKQGQPAWAANINGIVKLKKFIEKHNIKYVVIDSAKSVSSRGGWSYIDNESTRVFLQYLREIIAQPNKAHIEILSHDGTARGAHAGAKSWAEEPSMVMHLQAKKDEDTNETIGVTAEFKKDRAASIDPRRTITYKLVDAEMELVENKDIVGSCEDVILEIMGDFYKQGLEKVSRKHIVDTAYKIASAKRKTVDNTLGIMVNRKKLKRFQKGFYGLVDSEIQKVENSSR
tara:strand:+ start:32 stop:1330 length:1299 start_codon:yes stop_codon:yes gene_type:complete